jgi:hypothetical protein
MSHLLIVYNAIVIEVEFMDEAGHTTFVLAAIAAIAAVGAIAAIGLIVVVSVYLLDDLAVIHLAILVHVEVAKQSARFLKTDVLEQTNQHLLSNSL